MSARCGWAPAAQLTRTFGSLVLNSGARLSVYRCTVRPGTPAPTLLPARPDPVCPFPPPPARQDPTMLSLGIGATTGRVIGADLPAPQIPDPCEHHGLAGGG